MGLQHAAEARFAGDIDPFVGQHRHDARRRQLGEARFVGDPQDFLSLGLAQRMGGHGTDGLGPAISPLEVGAAPSALQGLQGDAGLDTCAPQPGPAAVRFVYRTSDPLAIF